MFKRRSKDKKVNKGGRELINFMNDHGMIIANGIEKEACLRVFRWEGIQ